MLGELRRITYPNFKSSVDDEALHHAYLSVWNHMSMLQNPRPFSGRMPLETPGLDQGALRDLVAEAEQSERQAEIGPYFPERGITKESLLAYAAKCRASVERYKDGGAHRAVLKGEA